MRCPPLQVFFCFAQSVASTRWAIQDEMHLQNTQCDNCLIGTMIALQYLACICDVRVQRVGLGGSAATSCTHRTLPCHSDDDF